MSEHEIPTTTNPELHEANAYDSRMHFLNLRPHHYVSSDARRIDIPVEYPSVKHALLFGLSKHMYRSEDGELHSYAAWKYDGIQSVDFTNDDPTSISYFVDADCNIPQLQEQIGAEIDDIYAARQRTEAVISQRLEWHQAHMKRLGSIAATPLLQKHRLSIAEWNEQRPHKDDKPQSLEPYVAPEPAKVRYSNMRPVGYKTEDALPVTIEFDQHRHLKRFLSSVIRQPSPSIMSPEAARHWTYWEIFGLQSLDKRNCSRTTLQFYIDSDLDPTHITDSLHIHQIATMVSDGLSAKTSLSKIMRQILPYAANDPRLLQQSKRITDRTKDIMWRDHQVELKDMVNIVQLSAALLEAPTQESGKLLWLHRYRAPQSK